MAPRKIKIGKKKSGSRYTGRFAGKTIRLAEKQSSQQSGTNSTHSGVGLIIENEPPSMNELISSF